MPVLLQGDDRAHESHPDEQPARHLFRQGDARVEAIAHDHIAKHQHHHHGQTQGHDDVQDFAKSVDEFLNQHTSPKMGYR
jgi:acyl carrier protein phosphodiesterase